MKVLGNKYRRVGPPAPVYDGVRLNEFEVRQIFTTFPENAAPLGEFQELSTSPDLVARTLYVSFGAIDLPTDRDWFMVGRVQFLLANQLRGEWPLHQGPSNQVVGSSGYNERFLQFLTGGNQPTLRYERQGSHANYLSHIDVPPWSLKITCDKIRLYLDAVNSAGFPGSSIFAAGLYCLSQKP